MLYARPDKLALSAPQALPGETGTCQSWETARTPIGFILIKVHLYPSGSLASPDSYQSPALAPSLPRTAKNRFALCSQAVASLLRVIYKGVLSQCGNTISVREIDITGEYLETCQRHHNRAWLVALVYSTEGVSLSL